MILSYGEKEFFHITGPCVRAAVFQVIRVRIIIKSLDLKGVIPVSDIMALTVHSSYQVKKDVEHPVKNKQHLYLLPEMDLLMAHKLRLIVWLSGDPDENEK